MEAKKIPDPPPPIRPWVIKFCIIMAWVDVALGFLLLFLGINDVALMQFGFAAFSWLSAWFYIKINKMFDKKP